MKHIKTSTAVKAVLLTILLLKTVSVCAQGDDFPFPGAPSPWDNPGPNLVPGGTILGQKVTSGTIGQASQVINVKGDSVIVRYVQDFRDPVPLLVRIASDGARSMTWVGGDDWQGWGCLRWCEWEVVTSAPNIQLWIEFVGIRGTFGAHLEIEEVKRGPVITQAQKDAARSQRTSSLAWSSALNMLAVPVACGAPFWKPVCVGVIALAEAFGLNALRQQGIIDDPWDDLWFVLYDPSFSDTLSNYIDPGDDNIGIAPYIDDINDMMILAAGYMDMVAVTANRQSSALMVGGPDGDYWAEQQYWRGKWGIDWIDYLHYRIAYDLWQIQYVYGQNFNPWIDGIGSNGDGMYLQDFIVSMAQATSDFASTFAN
jgi:hypothetical protein